MQFPSLQKLASAALSVVKRFPFEILSALTGTIAATVNIELKYIDRESENVFIRIMIAAELSLLLCFAATLFAESKKLDTSKKLMLRLAAIFLAVVLFFLIHPVKGRLITSAFFCWRLVFICWLLLLLLPAKIRYTLFGSLTKPCFCGY